MFTSQSGEPILTLPFVNVVAIIKKKKKKKGSLDSETFRCLSLSMCDNESRCATADILKLAPKCSKKGQIKPHVANLSFFHQQSKLHMEGFRSLREGEAVEFMFKKSSKGLESVWVTGPDGAPCLGSERRPKSAQKRRSKADR